jgi:hypothetical protein
MIWLASFPRSGNTFLRIVLHEVYGVASSTYHKEMAYPVDSRYEAYAAVKTHLLPSELTPSDPAIPAVYIVRDGRDTLVSIAHHRSDLVAPGSDYYANLKEAILAQGGSFFGGWSRNVSEWLKRASLVIRFEDLIADPIASCERLRPFLDLPSPRREKLPTFEDLKTRELPPYGVGRERGVAEEEMRRRQARFFRKGTASAWKDEMPEDLQGLFWKLHGPTMKRLGYPRGESASRRIFKFIKRTCLAQ